MTQNRYQNPQRSGQAASSGTFRKDDYLKDGYFDADRNIRCELLTSMAEKKARDLGGSGITYTQLRSFFTQVRAIERELESKKFPQVVPRIQRLEYLVANYVGRGQNETERQNREALKQFIDSNAKLAEKGESSFKEGFIPHFEAVIAYFKYLYPRK